MFESRPGLKEVLISRPYWYVLVLDSGACKLSLDLDSPLFCSRSWPGLEWASWSTLWPSWQHPCAAILMNGQFRSP